MFNESFLYISRYHYKYPSSWISLPWSCCEIVFVIIMIGDWSIRGYRFWNRNFSDMCTWLWRWIVNVAHDMKQIIVRGSGGEAPREKIGNSATSKWIFSSKSFERHTVWKIFPLSRGGGYLTQIIKFENVPYLGGVFI